MGLVMSKLPSQSLGFGMSMIIAFFHSFGMSERRRHLLYRLSNCYLIIVLDFLRRMFCMPDKPGALYDAELLRILLNSS